MTSFMYKIRDFSNPRLLIMQFISNKMKVLHFGGGMKVTIKLPATM